MSDIQIYIWDHNKERMVDRACKVIDDSTADMVSGIAFHWYSGDHFDAVRIVSELFPDKHLVFSEGCIEYSRFDTNQLRNAQMYGHDMIGNFAAGMDGFIDWNICLNEHGGPNYVGNYCEAPIICDTENKVLYDKLSFHYISHFSSYIQPKGKAYCHHHILQRNRAGRLLKPRWLHRCHHYEPSEGRENRQSAHEWQSDRFKAAALLHFYNCN